MGQIKLSTFETDAAPSLGLFGGSPSADPDGDPDAASLCIAWKGVRSSHLFYSQLPWTAQSHISGSQITGRPALCTSGNDIGHAWAWKNASGTGMSWAAEGVAGIQTVPNHAHTVSSPAMLVVGDAIDPATGGIDFNAFTLFWQGDAVSGSSGAAPQLWSMSYAEGSGWGTPVQNPGAAPTTSPAACLGPSAFNTFAATLAWTDRNGQIWLSQGGDSDANTPWSTPVPGPNACTMLGPAVCYFQGSLIVAWTVQGLGWIMYSILTPGADGQSTWSDPVRLVDGLTADTPALAEFSGTLYVAWRDFDHSISYETFASRSHLPQSGALPAGWPVAITNTIVGHAFTGTILIGSQFDPVNVIIDTGSSALSVLASKYDAASDLFLVPTTLTQYDAYGPQRQTGFWFGPVVETQVALPVLGLTLPAPVFGRRVSVAIADDSSTKPVFSGADGILGLAYSNLNKGYDISDYLIKLGESPVTYPWPIPAAQTPPNFAAFDSFIKSAKAPAVPVPPCMTQLVQEGLLPDKFALLVFRALQNLRTPTPATDPSNSGALILGGGEEYFVNQVGPYQAAEVVADTSYCLNLIAVQVGSNPPIPALPGLILRTGGVSNALLDSGTSGILLQTALYATVMAELNAWVPAFPNIINVFFQALNTSINMADWPSINFILAGPGGTAVTLSCFPLQYWQTDAGQAGVAQFMLSGLADPTESSILGLTLMTGYYTVFDRSVDGLGIINFAQRPLV